MESCHRSSPFLVLSDAKVMEQVSYNKIGEIRQSSSIPISECFWANSAIYPSVMDRSTSVQGHFLLGSWQKPLTWKLPRSKAWSIASNNATGTVAINDDMSCWCPLSGCLKPEAPQVERLHHSIWRISYWRQSQCITRWHSTIKAQKHHQNEHNLLGMSLSFQITHVILAPSLLVYLPFQKSKILIRELL